MSNLVLAGSPAGQPTVDLAGGELRLVGGTLSPLTASAPLNTSATYAVTLGDNAAPTLTWQAPTETITNADGSVTVTVLIGGVFFPPPGEYVTWVRVSQGAESVEIPCGYVNIVGVPPYPYLDIGNGLITIQVSSGSDNLDGTDSLTPVTGGSGSDNGNGTTTLNYP